MTSTQRIVANERHVKEVGWFKPMFAHCIRCAGFEDCYPEGRGPNFLDPDCYRYPMTEMERESAKQAAVEDEEAGL